MSVIGSKWGFGQRCQTGVRAGLGPSYRRSRGASSICLSRRVDRPCLISIKTHLFCLPSR